MDSNPVPFSPYHPIARRWVMGTTILSILALIIWGADLARGDISMLFYSRMARIFLILAPLYCLLLAARARVTLRPPRRAKYWRRNLGVIYWLITIPLLWYVGMLAVFWNGVPGV